MGQRTEGKAVGVALPDHVYMADGQVDGGALGHLLGNVAQHAIAHVDGVVQPDQATGHAMDLREMLEHPFAADAGLRVFPRRVERGAFVRADVGDRHEGIDAAGREGRDAGRGEGFGHQPRKVGVHRPGQALVAGGPELVPSHENDVPGPGQSFDGRAIHQIALDRLDPPGVQLVARGGVREPGDADHPLVRRGAGGHAGERRPDLSRDAQYHDVAVQRVQLGRGGGIGAGQQLFQRIKILDPVRQGLVGHGRILVVFHVVASPESVGCLSAQGRAISNARAACRTARSAPYCPTI